MSFFFIFKFSIQNCVSLFLTIFNILFCYLEIKENMLKTFVFIDIWFIKEDIKKCEGKTTTLQFCHKVLVQFSFRFSHLSIQFRILLRRYSWCVDSQTYFQYLLSRWFSLRYYLGFWVPRMHECPLCFHILFIRCLNSRGVAMDLCLVHIIWTVSNFEIGVECQIFVFVNIF